MNENQRNEKGTDVLNETSLTTEVNADGEDTFKISVRKLEMPVCPRGVLAE